jgi:hypothetical protein
MDRYVARDKATIALMGAPPIALAREYKMAKEEKTWVERPMHVAIVYGLKRYLKQGLERFAE